MPPEADTVAVSSTGWPYVDVVDEEPFTDDERAVLVLGGGMTAGLDELKGKVMYSPSTYSVTPLEFAEMPVVPKLKLTLAVDPQLPSQCHVVGLYHTPEQLESAFQKVTDPLPDPDTSAVNPLVDRLTSTDKVRFPLNWMKLGTVTEPLSETEPENSNWKYDVLLAHVSCVLPHTTSVTGPMLRSLPTLI